MSAHVVDLLPDLLDGALDPGTHRVVQAHLATCTACRAERASLEEVWGALATALRPEVASPDLRRRLMADTRTGRLHHMAPALAAFFDLDEAAARALLDRADDPAEWRGFPVPGVRYMPVTSGPAVAHRQNGLIHIPAGTHFPLHRHHGTERTLVLTGRLRDDDGHTYDAGDISPKTPETQHTFVAEGRVHLFCGLAIETGCSFVR
jgi:predicted ChrR family anti-sigma factor